MSTAALWREGSSPECRKRKGSSCRGCGWQLLWPGLREEPLYKGARPLTKHQCRPLQSQGTGTRLCLPSCSLPEVGWGFFPAHLASVAVVSARVLAVSGTSVNGRCGLHLPEHTFLQAYSPHCVANVFLTCAHAHVHGNTHSCTHRGTLMCTHTRTCAHGHTHVHIHAPAGWAGLPG